MIHGVCKTYGITKGQAADFTEYDFWLMQVFESNEAAVQKALMKSGNE